jgi:branched-subunit amino acid transport protein
MLLLAFIARLIPVRALETDQGPNHVNRVLGHVGLTIIALVYVLIIMWQN